MKIKLDRYDLKILVLGSSPHITQWEKFKHLRWHGLDPMTWSWNQRALARFTDEELFDLYIEIKRARKEEE